MGVSSSELAGASPGNALQEICPPRVLADVLLVLQKGTQDCSCKIWALMPQKLLPRVAGECRHNIYFLWRHIGSICLQGVRKILRLLEV